MTISRNKKVLICGLLVCVLCFVSNAYADLDMDVALCSANPDFPAQNMDVVPCFDGYHKHSRWLALRIALTSVDEDVTGELTVEMPDSTTGRMQTYSSPATLYRATRKVQYLHVLPESFRRNLQVKLTDNRGKELLQKDVSLETIPPEDLLIVVVGRSGGLGFLAPAGEDARSPGVHISYSTADLLPDAWKGYDSVDVMVLGDVSFGALSAHQHRAITDWLYDGGRLVVSGGAHSQNLIGSFVERVLPVRLSGTRVLSSMSSLTRQFGGEMVGVSLVVTSSELADGATIIAAEDGLPIIAEKEVGDGKVVFLAFDYLDPALRSWDGRKDMWEMLLPQPESRRQPRDADIARLLSASGSVRLPSYKLVGLFLLSYILCFGPLNYLVLNKTGKDGLKWLTMPAITAVFIIASLGFVYALRGEAAVVNDLSVVDVYQDVGRARVDSYFSLFSSARSDYRIEFPASEAIFANRMPSLDGKSSQEGDYRLIENETFQMEILNVEALSSILFHGGSYVEFSDNISINLSRRPEGEAHGEVISNLPFDLIDCYVFSNGYRYFVGDLSSGAQAKFRPDQTRIYAGNIYDIYSTGDGKRLRFARAMRPILSRRAPRTGLVGWVEESMLKALAEMDMEEDYESSGMALIIVHL